MLFSQYVGGLCEPRPKFLRNFGIAGPVFVAGAQFPGCFLCVISMYVFVPSVLKWALIRIPKQPPFGMIFAIFEVAEYTYAATDQRRVWAWGESHVYIGGNTIPFQDQPVIAR
jgi:hypothetical protein